MSQGTVLVTGGAGYIGSHACKALAAAGYRPVTYDNLSIGNRWAVRWGPLERGDILDAARLHEVFKRAPAGRGAAFRGAGAGRRVDAGARPLLPHQRHRGGEPARRLPRPRRAGVRVLLDLRGLRHARAHADRRGRGAAADQSLRRLEADGRAHPRRLRHGLRAAPRRLRYFNAAGADPDGEIGEARDVETHLVPLALDAVLGRRPPLQVFGDDYPTPDGTAVRDYIHVSDLAEAHVRALGLLLAGAAVAQAEPRHRPRLFGAPGARRGRGRRRPAGAAWRWRPAAPATRRSSSPTRAPPSPCSART